MTEISDKLWVAVDYMGGNNVDGAVSFGVSWAFSKNVSVIFGYDIYKEKELAGNNTFTTQLDINYPVIFHQCYGGCKAPAFSGKELNKSIKESEGRVNGAPFENN